MTLRTLSLALLLSAPLLPACDSGEGDEGGEGPNIDCATVTPPKYSEMTAWSKCVTCHSSTLTGPARANAPVGINYDTYDAAKANAAEAMSEVYEGAMPIAGSPQLSEAEKTQIYNWASCDTPQ